MTTAVNYVLASAALCWIQLVTASLHHSRGWTPGGLHLAFGNREAMPEPSPGVARAKRASANMNENLLLLGVVFSAAVASSADPGQVALGAGVFFWARVAHWLLYVAGVAYLRTGAWAVGVAGLAIIGAAALD